VICKKISALPAVLVVPGNMEIRSVADGYACVDTERCVFVCVCVYIYIHAHTWSIFCSRFHEVILGTLCNVIPILKVIRGLNDLSKYFKGKYIMFTTCHCALYQYAQ